MTEYAQQIAEVRKLFEELEGHRTLYAVAKEMSKSQQTTQTQVERIKDSGRCQPWQLTVLKRMRDEVSRETSQNVTNKLCLSRPILNQ